MTRHSIQVDLRERQTTASEIVREEVMFRGSLRKRLIEKEEARQVNERNSPKPVPHLNTVPVTHLFSRYIGNCPFETRESRGGVSGKARPV